MYKQEAGNTYSTGGDNVKLTVPQPTLSCATLSCGSAEKKAPAVLREIDLLGSATNELTGLVGDLVGRLESVFSEDVPNEEEDSFTPETDLGKIIREHTNKVFIANRILRNILNRLEI